MQFEYICICLGAAVVLTKAILLLPDIWKRRNENIQAKKGVNKLMAP